MPRAKRGFKARRRHNRILKLAKGYRGAHSKLFRSAVEAVQRGLCYAYRDRSNVSELSADFGSSVLMRRFDLMESTIAALLMD
jgi:ribosomal protein L20